MKKLTSKPALSLSRETVKQLATEMRAIAGGVPVSVASHCGDQDCSFSCDATCWACPRK